MITTPSGFHEQSCRNEVEKRGPYGLADFFIIPAAGQLGDIDGDSCGKADNDIRKKHYDAGGNTNSSNGIFTDKIAGYHGIGYIV